MFSSDFFAICNSEIAPSGPPVKMICQPPYQVKQLAKASYTYLKHLLWGTPGNLTQVDPCVFSEISSMAVLVPIVH
jgi:hypothetical protein